MLYVFERTFTRGVRWNKKDVASRRRFCFVAGVLLVGAKHRDRRRVERGCRARCRSTWARLLLLRMFWPMLLRRRRRRRRCYCRLSPSDVTELHNTLLSAVGGGNVRYAHERTHAGTRPPGFWVINATLSLCARSGRLPPYKIGNRRVVTVFQVYIIIQQCIHIYRGIRKE